MKPIAEFAAKSWRTTTLGILMIALAAWHFHNQWVPFQTAWFNLSRVVPVTLAILIGGWGLVHARDHRCQ